MKKTVLILAVVCMSAAANATILRVSNVSGSSAPYTSIEDAHAAASSGDTIMFDASNTAYFTNTFTLTKSLVLIGPGYWLVDNGIVEEGASSAKLGGLHLKGEGSVVKGLNIAVLYVEAPKIVVNRCYLGKISFSKGADNGIVHQNFITSSCTTVGGASSISSYVQITNNIFTTTGTGGTTAVGHFANSYIAYNTFRTSQVYTEYITGTTFEYNIYEKVKEAGSDNSYENNYETNLVNVQATNDFIDKDYYGIEIPEEVRSTYGAFAGDSPYVFSGVPSGPVIQDLQVPTTVEMGSKLNVTVKVGMQQ